MKKLFIIPVLSILVAPAMAMTTTTTTEETYESVDRPISPYTSDEIMRDERRQEMEERNYNNSSINRSVDDSVNRPRTNRERKALNTGSNASDDKSGDYDTDNGYDD